MTTTVARMTGLALLAASFAFSGSLAYADTEGTTSIQILTFDAVGNPGEIIAALDCDTGDGMGNCPVETLVAADTATTVADVFDPAVLEATADATAGAAEPTLPFGRLHSGSALESPSALAENWAAAQDRTSTCSCLI